MDRNAPLQKLELEAYTAVLRALAATAMDWSKERLMTEIRRELHITTEVHFEVLSTIMADDEITAIREGKPLPANSSYAIPSELPSRRQSQPPSHRGPGRPSTNRSSMPAPAAVTPSSERRGPGRPPNRGRLANGGADHNTTALRKRGKHRTVGGTQANEFVGRSIWRHWPNEAQQWVKGIISDYKPTTNQHIIVYDMDTPNESWEEYDLSRGKPGADYDLDEEAVVPRQPAAAATAAPLRTASMSRKRKQAGVQQLPYPNDELQQQLATGSAPELEAMREALEARARELVSELVALAAPVNQYPDPAERMQLQLQDLAARETYLRSRLDEIGAVA